MRYTIIYILVLLCSCSSTKNRSIAEQAIDPFVVTEISSINSWNIIYASKNDSLYKIVTKKERNKNCDKIVIGQSYDFILHSRKKSAPEINGVKISPVNNIDIECYSYDEETEICIEPDKKVYDLYHTDSLKGLCY